ncbi:MAG TPA: hypothetical protein DIU15_01515 [Deltaproteobacteria bacterium]|nr:hypothetical protein [Deltaproteobacteria bacterium]HCP44703.1 hypothetical protein [Deltaproteobacteria bacterium]
MAQQDKAPTLSFSITVDGQNAGTQEFEQEMVTIGKGAAAVLQISDDGLADLHAAVQLADDGTITLLDLGSESGTLLNGESINNSPIKDGDEIKLSKTVIKLSIPDIEQEEDTDEAEAPIAAELSEEEAELEIGEAEDVMDFVLRSGTADSDLGIQRKAPKILEVAEIWSGTVLNVRHFGPDAKAVYVGDRQAQSFRVASAVLMAILVIGVGFFMVKHVTLPVPPREPAIDTQMIERWQAETAKAKAEEAEQKRLELAAENEQLRKDAEARIQSRRGKYDRKINEAENKARKRHDEKQAEARNRHEASRAEDPSLGPFIPTKFCLSVLSKQQVAEVEARTDRAAAQRLCVTEARNVFSEKILTDVMDSIREEREAAAEAEAEKNAPPNPLRDLRDSWTARTKKKFERAIKSNRENIPLVPPQFELFEKPDYEDFIANQMLPVVREAAPKGEVRPSTVEQLKEFEKTYEIYDDLDEKRVVEDVVLATRIIRDDGKNEVLMTVAGMNPEKIYALDKSGREVIIPNEEEVFLWGPSEQEVQARTDLFHEIQKLLYANATERRRGRDRCDAAEQLLEFDEHKKNFEYNAVFAECLANRGNLEVGREYASRAIDNRPENYTRGEAAQNYLKVLQVQSRALLKDAHEAELDRPSHELMNVEKREAALASHEALRDFIHESMKDPGALRAVDKGIFLLKKEQLREMEREQVRHAMAIALFIVLLLPIGFGFDEVRARQLAQDFFVSSESLPSDHFPLVQQTPANTLVNFVPGSAGFLESEGDRTPIADLVSSGRASKQSTTSEGGDYFQVELGENERFVNDIGHMVFFIHRVFQPKVIPAPFGQNIDWMYLGVLAALLFLGGALGVNLLLTPYDPSQQIVEIPDRFVELMVQEVEKEKKKKEPSGNPDAGEGAKAKDEEGKTGKKEHKLKKAKGSKVAIKKSELDKQIAESTGLLADLQQMTDNSMFGAGGLDNQVSNALGGLIGSQYGNQYGAGGLGSRGSGLGGGGTAAGLGGLGTRGSGMGASGYGRGGGFYGKKGGGSPGVGTGDPIILGALDKSIIDRIVKQHLAKIRYCYQKELNKNPKLFGKVVVKFVIAKDGSVSSASTKASTLNNPIVEKCINSRFMRMRFPSPKGGGIVIVSYPFVFNTQGG